MSPGGKLPPLPAGAGDESIANLDALRAGNGTEPTAAVRKEMQKVMQNCAAVYRTGESLQEGVQLIDQCAAKVPKVKVRQREAPSRRA
jgi:succinate dehydrogenase/fumarate reductase flavoprotein subunit